MKKHNIKNERVKRKFIQWLREADGCCEATIDNIEKAVLIYEEFTKTADFGSYSPDKAIEFKKHLRNREFRGRPISIVTYHTYLRHLRKFFAWLAWQPGYKSKIAHDSIDYLKIKEKEERMATQTTPRNYPSLEYAIKMANSITINSEVDQRDRALISFTLLSGMRDEAIVTLPLDCFDENNLTINQNPRAGVRTKFSKYIFTTLFRFDEQLVEYAVEWAKYLKKKGFGSADPLFPRSKTNQGKENLSFESATEIEPIFWQGTGRIREIFKKRSDEARLPYFPPHTFRHLAVDLALKHCRTGEEIKAISQNFGHEHIATTLSSYANYGNARLTEILKSIDFSKKQATIENDKIEKIRKILLD
ncbi:MAG: hypothetical protein CVT49_07400 [candidate division Zixibacteria bacterium HGW-Zixibacteria-1]|nr:MAG: hypothetical protein CVT49_07400 [candidate division Zixibacteria bacterium HGW-Zixibacteria-1]